MSSSERVEDSGVQATGSTPDDRSYVEAAVAAYPNRDAAERAVRQLVEDGFAAEDISVLASETALGADGTAGSSQPAEPEEPKTAGEHLRNTLTGALEGSVFGLLVGLENLVLGSVVVPVVAMGPLATYTAESFSARNAGDLAHLEEGGVLVLLHAREHETAVRARDLLAMTDPESLEIRPVASAPNG